MPSPKRSRRLGTLLVLLGCVSILGGAFAAGVYTGRLGARTPPKKLLEVDKDVSAARQRDRARPSEPQPPLTFYQELTAPLTAPPPVPKAAKPKTTEAPKPPEPADSGSTFGAPAPPPGPPAAAAPPAGDYTVQVGAYKVAGQAEALRATLASGGWDSRVVAAEVGDGVRYRVQVGTYPTREAARAAAARLAAERSLPTLVTAR